MTRIKFKKNADSNFFVIKAGNNRLRNFGLITELRNSLSKIRMNFRQREIKNKYIALLF